MNTFKRCKIRECKNKHYGKGYCNKHYQQLRLYKKILKITKYDLNKIIDCSGYYEICLYNSKHKETGKALIDKEDLKKAKNYKWYLYNKGYVITRINKKTQLFLHHLILGRKKGFDIDHINHNPMDNRKQNLRFATSSQNKMNKKVKGYCWNRLANKWMAYIGINHKSIHLGYFTDKQDADKARREAEQKYFGEFAYKK